MVLAPGTLDEGSEKPPRNGDGGTLLLPLPEAVSQGWRELLAAEPQHYQPGRAEQGGH